MTVIVHFYSIKKEDKLLFIALVQGSQIQIGRRALFYSPRAAVYEKKAFAGRNMQEKPSK